MTKPAIKVTGLTKDFRVWNKPSDMLMEAVTGRTRHTDFRALDDVSFELLPGTVLGVLGRNGAGKSTLLRLVAGTLEPSHGKVEVNGRIASILELGTGFHQDYSGRENIFLGGMCLGLSRSDIKKKVDEIIDFAELREFIDRPFRTYSSGMQARLTFAVATSIDPDILIIDEALSVGDARFTLKSFDRIQKFRTQGKAILLVSHDIQTVSAFCDSAILLERGRLVSVGPAVKVVNIYHELLFGTGRPVAEEPVIFAKRESVAAPVVEAAPVIEVSADNESAAEEPGNATDLTVESIVEAPADQSAASLLEAAAVADDKSEPDERAPDLSTAEASDLDSGGAGPDGVPTTSLDTDATPSPDAETEAVEMRAGAPELRIVPTDPKPAGRLLLPSGDDLVDEPKSEQHLRYGDRLVEIVRFQIVDSDGHRVTRLQSLQPYLFHMRLRARGPAPDVGVGVLVRTVQGMQVTASNSLEPKPTLMHTFSEAGEEVDIVVPFNVNMGHGTYFASAICARVDSHKHDAQFDVLEFFVERTTCHDQSVANLGMSFEFASDYSAAPAKRIGGAR